MPNLIVWIVIFIVSLFVLIKASDFFTDAAEKIGISLGISPFL
ncbi:MAG: sodium:calcium antiporter, partial [Okeania sp. SIO2H7]|nr:sodium:calcium antiporter [Okeania sp. SIO2H7]